MRFYLVKEIVLYLLVPIMFLPLFSFGQAPDIEWSKCYGGTLSETTFDLKKTFDGGFVMIGAGHSTDGDKTINYGAADIWVVKTDSEGVIEWEKSIGGSNEEWGFAIEQTQDSGYILCGFTESIDNGIIGNHGGSDFYVVKLSSNGSIVWQKCYGGSLADQAQDVKQTPDGGYIVVGLTQSTNGNVTGNHGDNDFWVIKLNSLGNLIWKKCYGGTSSEIARSVENTADGGFIIVGEASSNDGDVTGNHLTYSYDVWVVKINSLGTIQWKKCYGGTDAEKGYKIKQTTDGGYIIIGDCYTNSGDVSGSHGAADIWVVKIDSVGTIEWKQCYGGSAGDFSPFDIVELNSGGYAFVGLTMSNDFDVTGNLGNVDAWIVKLDLLGNIIWQKCLGGSGQEMNMPRLAENNDGSIVASISVVSNDGVAVSNHGGSDFLLVKLGSTVGVENEKKQLISMLPNPVNDFITINGIEGKINLGIYDVEGKLIQGKMNTLERIIDVRNLKNGVYIIKVEQGKGVEVKKILIQR